MPWACRRLAWSSRRRGLGQCCAAAPQARRAGEAPAATRARARAGGCGAFLRTLTSATAQAPGKPHTGMEPVTKRRRLAPRRRAPSALAAAPPAAARASAQAPDGCRRPAARSARGLLRRLPTPGLPHKGVGLAAPRVRLTRRRRPPCAPAAMVPAAARAKTEGAR
jgi:hypothetical protein